MKSCSRSINFCAHSSGKPKKEKRRGKQKRWKNVKKKLLKIEIWPSKLPSGFFFTFTWCVIFVGSPITGSFSLLGFERIRVQSTQLEKSLNKIFPAPLQREDYPVYPYPDAALSIAGSGSTLFVECESGAGYPKGRIQTKIGPTLMWQKI